MSQQTTPSPITSGEALKIARDALSEIIGTRNLTATKDQFLHHLKGVAAAALAATEAASTPSGEIVTWQSRALGQELNGMTTFNAMKDEIADLRAALAQRASEHAAEIESHMKRCDEMRDALHAEKQRASAPDAHHPVQPLVTDKHGCIRFKRNVIVDHLANGKLNDLAALDFPQEDWEQLAQLIGYSLDGFGTLSYVTDETYERAAAQQPADGGAA